MVSRSCCDGVPVMLVSRSPCDGVPAVLVSSVELHGPQSVNSQELSGDTRTRMGGMASSVT